MIRAIAVLAQVPRAADSGGSGDTLLLSGDSLAAAAGAIRDTLSRVPLPGGVAKLLRFLFQVPQWIQIGGALLGAAVAGWVLWQLWRRRLAILSWLRTRSRQVQAVLGAALLLAVALVALAGMKSWDYMQHENAFCTGCHIMERPFQRFATGAGKHEDRKCHDCHQQSIMASTRQLVLWVAERPEKIGVHAPVPNARCESCHQLTGGKETWEHVKRLAGHRVHFESDSSALQGLACVKCHGAEVHKFLPSARTCEQSGCHEQQPIKLGHMAKLPQISCVTCHKFTADLPGLASRDSARGALVPQQAQCFSCHQMKSRLAGYDLAKDPHKGSCGSCHDVHSDSVPRDARASCRQCHNDLSRSPFHTGTNHARVQAQCVTCHQPHAAGLDAADCVGCHSEVRRRGLFKAPLPFDTAAVLKRRLLPVPTAMTVPEPGLRAARGPSDAEPVWNEEGGVGWVPVASFTGHFSPADSFPHSRHKTLACLTCHRVDRPGRGGGLVFQAPRGCDLCHHQALSSGKVEQRDCLRCHRQESVASVRPAELLVRVGSRAPRTRSVGFRHERHAKLACAECHVPPEAAPPDSVQRCTACHDQHHAEARDCALCHNTAVMKPAHQRPDHVGCTACHATSTVAKLVPVRSFCLTCHEAQRTHLPGRECSTCHFLSTPAEFRRHLLSREPA